MRTREEFMDEVFARSKTRREENKKKKKQAAIIFSFLLCVCIGSVSVLDRFDEDHISEDGNLSMSGDKNDFADGSEFIKDMTNSGPSAAGSNDGRLFGAGGVTLSDGTGLAVIDYSAEYFRVNWSEEGGVVFRERSEAGGDTGSSSQNSIIIDSVRSLDNFKRIFGRHFLNGNDGFSKKTEGLDEEFFEKKSLIVIYLSEGSGSVRHEVTNIYGNNKLLYIAIKRIVPEVVTCDMAGWLVTIEIDKDSAEKYDSVYVSVK
ncbi:MAG: hypothetical protein E7672_00390 [Ruminococcaceae bacterium]|nr:hypothetical protein [Oscillospiraceae bacterium]